MAIVANTKIKLIFCALVKIINVEKIMILFELI